MLGLKGVVKDNNLDHSSAESEEEDSYEEIHADGYICVEAEEKTKSGTGTMYWGYHKYAN